MRSRIFAVSFVLLTTFALSVTAAFGADMFSGTWQLNFAKSTFIPSPMSAKEPLIQKITPVDNGIRMVEDYVTMRGQKEHDDFTVKFDGKDYPSISMLDGKPAYPAEGTVSAKKIADYTFELTFKIKVTGKLIFTAKNVIAKDGKTRTATQTFSNDQGQTAINTLLFEKQ